MNTTAEAAAEAAIAGAVRRWMAGEALDAETRAIVEQVLEHNWQTQLGRLCIPQQPARQRDLAA